MKPDSSGRLLSEIYLRSNYLTNFYSRKKNKVGEISEYLRSFFMYGGGHEGSVVGHLFGRGCELGISLDHFVDRIEEIFFCSHLKKRIEELVT